MKTYLRITFVFILVVLLLVFSERHFLKRYLSYSGDPLTIPLSWYDPVENVSGQKDDDIQVIDNLKLSNKKYKWFGSFSKYFQALGYTSTLLFHMIPAITDFLRRLPLGDPFIDSFEDPLLMNFHLSFLIVYILIIIAQIIWLKRQTV